MGNQHAPKSFRLTKTGRVDPSLSVPSQPRIRGSVTRTPGVCHLVAYVPVDAVGFIATSIITVAMLIILTSFGQAESMLMGLSSLGMCKSGHLFMHRVIVSGESHLASFCHRLAIGESVGMDVSDFRHCSGRRKFESG